MTELTDLERQVHERTAQLEATNEELRAFAYSISHDLRAPLRSIDGFSRALIEDCSDSLPETDRDYLLRIRRAAKYMGQMIDATLTLSRLTTGDLQRKRFSLSELSESILREIAQAEPRPRAYTSVQPGLVVDADPNLLAIALDNLLRNAWKFTARTPSPRVEVGAQEADQGRVYFVRDNGVGFQQEYASRLFSPFVRLHSADEFEGTGIGLATVQRIIHRHGGRIWAKGAVHAGATIYFTLV